MNSSPPSAPRHEVSGDDVVLGILGVEDAAGGGQAEQASHADEPLSLGTAVEGQVGPGGQAGDTGAPVDAVLTPRCSIHRLEA
jgi:hypothetical protein